MKKLILILMLLLLPVNCWAVTIYFQDGSTVEASQIQRHKDWASGKEQIRALCGSEWKYFDMDTVDIEATREEIRLQEKIDKRIDERLRRY